MSHSDDVEELLCCIVPVDHGLPPGGRFLDGQDLVVEARHQPCNLIAAGLIVQVGCLEENESDRLKSILNLNRVRTSR